MDTTQILKIQQELAQRALAEPARRHKRLYRLVNDAGWLRAGLEAVFANRGSHTPGVDGVTKHHIDNQCQGRDRLAQELHEELLTEAYRPQPVKRVYIPKAPRRPTCRRGAIPHYPTRVPPTNGGGIGQSGVVKKDAALARGALPLRC